MALKLLDDLCANEQVKENEVILQVQSSLNARIKLWDGVILATGSARLLSSQANSISTVNSSLPPGGTDLVVLFSGALGGDIQGSMQ